MGLSSYVYPGACHNRFQHALGATFLMTKAIESLRAKGVEISEQEAEAASLAILCHDIGHGPFSHCLEYELVDCHHEDISLMFFDHFINEFGSPFVLAKEIFSGTYHKQYLHQLVSSQLDVDRMDYLSRDSYFTGVVEGVIGFDRILNMINVVDNNLVIEAKGVYSVDKFLIARHLMYLQVYLHKTSLAAEYMLKNFVRRWREIGAIEQANNSLQYVVKTNYAESKSDFLENYSLLDDYDVWYEVKRQQTSDDPILKFLATSLIKRQIFGVYLTSNNVWRRQKVQFLDKTSRLGLDPSNVEKYLMYQVSEGSKAYHVDKEIIRVLLKSGDVVPIEQVSSLKVDFGLQQSDFWIVPKS